VLLEGHAVAVKDGKVFDSGDGQVKNIDDIRDEIQGIIVGDKPGKTSAA